MALLLVIITGATGTSYKASIEVAYKTFQISKVQINCSFYNLNTITIKYSMAILLTKRKLEYNHIPLLIKIM